MKIALFFTENMSLRHWHQAGLLHRDRLLYEYLCEAGHEVWFVTYGNEEDRDYLPQNSKIRLLTRPREMDYRTYSWSIHQLHGAILSQVDVIKSHQVIGSRFAVYAKWRLGNKPYIARCGYLPSYFMAQEGASRAQRGRNWLEEFISFHAADVVCVPSSAEIRYLKQRYQIRSQKAFACPNWVDPEAFAPSASVEKHPRRICFVARFQAQKDPLLLIEALKDIPQIELLMIGGGDLQAQIESKIREYGIQAQILPRVPNEDLPSYYQSSAIYVLPTHYEGGSPKTLFEAMACALPIVSTTGFGVNEAFEDGVHGYKIQAGDVSALRQAILQLLENPELGQQMGRQGREHVIKHFSIEAALEREKMIFDQLRK